MIKSDKKEQFQEILQQHPELFNAIGKLKNYKVELLTDGKVKPLAEPPRRMQYHLVDRVGKAQDEMPANDVVDEHPRREATRGRQTYLWQIKMMGRTELPCMRKI